MTTVAEFRALSSEEQVARLEELARAALPAFGFDATSPLTLLKHRENAVFRVDEPVRGERFVLRVHRQDYQSAEAIRSELHWMRALAADGVITPLPVAATDGELVVTKSSAGVPEARHCDVLTFVEGESLESLLAGAGASLEPVTLLGELCGRLHRHSRSWELPAGFVRRQWDEEGLLSERSPWGYYGDLAVLDADQRELIGRARKRTLERLAVYGKSADRYGLIHADFMPDNVLVKDGRAAVLDFDDSGFGWYLYDPATFLAFHVVGDFDSVRDAWLEGYRSVVPMDAEALAELPTLIMARFLVGLGWMHTRRETEMAQQMTAAVVMLACLHAERFLAMEV